jgi:hypothetical protein
MTKGTPGDGWADTRGTFIAEVTAGPVYKLLGKKSLSDDPDPTDTFQRRHRAARR